RYALRRGTRIFAISQGHPFAVPHRNKPERGIIAVVVTALALCRRRLKRMRVLFQDIGRKKQEQIYCPRLASSDGIEASALAFEICQRSHFDRLLCAVPHLAVFRGRQRLVGNETDAATARLE